MIDAEREALIEKMARAIACHDADNPSECLSGEWCEENWICYRPEAVAAYHVLHARIAELEAALKPFDEMLQRDFSFMANDERYDDDFMSTVLMRLGDLRAARAALKETGDGNG